MNMKDYFVSFYIENTNSRARYCSQLPVELGLAVVVEHGANAVGTVELNQKLELFTQ
jgi:hypothetical protein